MSSSLSPEPRYAFRERLTKVHRSDRRDPSGAADPGEVVVTEDWRIVVAADADPLVHHTAEDLRDYFRCSMGIELGPISTAADPASRTIRLALANDAPADCTPPGTDPRSHTIVVTSDHITLVGRGARGVARAGHRLEELVNLRGVPCLAPGTWSRTPTFGPRMSHSGYGVDEFPDEHLAQLAHAGFDAILVFAAGPDLVPDGRTHGVSPASGQDTTDHGRHLRFADLADRAGRHGLDLYLYAYFHGLRPPHPDDPEAERFYDETYGACFAACPTAKGIVLVGESVEFPSRDPRTTGKLRLDPVPGNFPDTRPSPGWWPCTDYPAWVARVRDACRRHNPEAEIIFWTYNWGWAPEADRLALLRALPDDITVQVTFEMFEQFHHDGVTNVCVDYTISHEGPGSYFRSEAEVLHERGMRLSTMANTGGLTWDFGVVGHQPVPYQWARRHAAIRQAQRDWGLAAVMENHHYGWAPNIVSELTTAMYHDPAPDPAEFLARLARRDFGPGADHALAGWQDWSDAARDYVPTNADQYGPFRIGPAYPLTLFTVPTLVTDPHALFGGRIVKIPYQPDTSGTVATTAPPRRVPAEIASLSRMQQRWRSGIDHLAAAVGLTPDHLRTEAERMLILGRFIEHCITTTINTKRWWLAKSQLLVTADPERAADLLDELHRIGEGELSNAAAAIDCTDRDSRLGWEPSMGYVGDSEHIRWKIAHLRHALDVELPRYRDTITA